MGTHPIFESDFDCLTEKMGRNRRDKSDRRKQKGNGSSNQGIDEKTRKPVFEKNNASGQVTKNDQLLSSTVCSISHPKLPDMDAIRPCSSNLYNIFIFSYLLEALWGQ